MYVLRAIISVILLCLAGVWGGGGTGDGGGRAVVDVRSAGEFDRLLAGDQPLFVGFFSPSCSHCQRLAPEFERVADLVARGPAAHVRLIWLDASRLSTVAERYAVNAYPTLRFFGLSDDAVSLNRIGKHYAGARSAQAMSAWLVDQVAPGRAATAAAAAVEDDQTGRQQVVRGIAAALEADSNAEQQQVALGQASRRTPPSRRRQTFVEKAAECEAKCAGKRTRLPECDYFCIDSACFRRVWGQLDLKVLAQQSTERDEQKALLADPLKVEQFTHCAKLRLLPAIPQTSSSSRVIDQEEQQAVLEAWRTRQAEKKAKRAAQRQHQLEEQKAERADLDAAKRQKKQQMESTPPKDEL